MAESFIELRVSKDGGFTWSDWKARSIGEVGDFIRPAIWRRLGNSRHFTFDFRATGAPDILAGAILDAMGEWAAAPVAGGSYRDENRPWSYQDTCNYIPVRIERPGGRSEWKLRGAPGERLFANVGTGPIRGARDVEGKLFVVSGLGFYQVFPDTSSTLIGTIPGTGMVSLTHDQESGGNVVSIANGTRGWTYNTITEAFAEIDDEAFPGALTFEYLDQYTLYIEPQRRFAGHSGLADARSYSSIDRLEAESLPDRLLAQSVNAGQWVLFGERTTDLYTNTGAATGTFQKIPGATVDRGIAGTYAHAKTDGAIFLWGDDGSFYRLSGSTLQRLSTHPIEQQARLSDMSQIVCTVYEDSGHKIVWSSFADGKTWGYDVATQEWFRRESYGLTRWRMSTLTKWRGVWIAGDYQTGKLYQVDWALRDESGSPLIGRRTTGALHSNEQRLSVNGVRLLVDTGRGATLPTGPGDIIDPLVIYNPLPQTYVGVAVSHSYLARGGVRPYVFSITDGALPDGLSMDADGLVTGTPTTNAEYAWRVMVTDAQGFTATLDQGIDAGEGIEGDEEYWVSNPLPTLATGRDVYGGDPDALSLFDSAVWSPASPVYRSLSSSPGGTYLSVGLASSPFIKILKYNVITDEYDALPNPATLPPAAAGRTAWHPSGNYLLVTLGSHADRFMVYARSGDTFTPIAPPTTLPTDSVFSCAWSPDGDKLAVCTTNSGSTVYLYPFLSGAIQTPSTANRVINLFGADIAFSHDSLWIAAGGNQGLEVFDAGGANIALFDSVATTPDCARGVNWSADDGYIYTLASVADGSSRRLAVYSFNGAAVAASDAIQFDNFPASQPTGGDGSAVTNDGLYLAIAEGDTQLKVYEANGTGDTLTLVASQPPASAGALSDVAWTNFGA